MGLRFVFLHPSVLAVSPWQLYNYAEPYPYGLLKLGAMLKKRGHEVELVDLMVYDFLERDVFGSWPGLPEHSVKRAGNNQVLDAQRTAYRLGHGPDVLREKLLSLKKPDEVWITGGMTFNWEPVHEAVRVSREVWPDVRIRLGGNYPSLAPDQARLSGADVVWEGPVPEAESEYADLSLFEKTPAIGLFNIGTGCSNRCTFCVNHRYRPKLRYDPEALFQHLVETRRKTGVQHFANWDPNVMLFPSALERFLDLAIEAKAGLTFAFNMGIQPNKLTEKLAAKMLRAGVTQITIPFESSDPVLLKRYSKPYSFAGAVESMRRVARTGFPTGDFHSTAVFGYEDDDPRHLFRTWLYMLAFQAQPVFFPINPVPTSVEFKRREAALAGKPHDELNGYLFPLLPSRELVELNELLLALLNQHYLERALPLVKKLPPEMERVFWEELAAMDELFQRAPDETPRIPRTMAEGAGVRSAQDTPVPLRAAGADAGPFALPAGKAGLNP